MGFPLLYLHCEAPLLFIAGDLAFENCAAAFAPQFVGVGVLLDLHEGISADGFQLL